MLYPPQILAIHVEAIAGTYSEPYETSKMEFFTKQLTTESC